MLERAFRGSAAGARHLSELYANAGQLRESWHREYSNRSRDRKGALGLWATPATLPYGRGSDWGFLLLHSPESHLQAIDSICSHSSDFLALWTRRAAWSGLLCRASTRMTVADSVAVAGCKRFSSMQYIAGSGRKFSSRQTRI